MEQFWQSSQRNRQNRQSRLGPRLRLGLSVALIAGLSLAATSTPSSPPAIQTQRLEVVNTSGEPVVVIRHTAQGGRLEVMNEAGATIFSVGGSSSDSDPLPSWDRARHDITILQRELANQRQNVHGLAKQLQGLARQQQKLQRRNNPSDSRHDLAALRRNLDSLDHEVRRLSRQIDTLKRR